MSEISKKNTHQFPRTQVDVFSFFVRCLTFFLDKWHMIIWSTNWFSASLLCTALHIHQWVVHVFWLIISASCRCATVQEMFVLHKHGFVLICVVFMYLSLNIYLNLQFFLHFWWKSHSTDYSSSIVLNQLGDWQKKWSTAILIIDGLFIQFGSFRWGFGLLVREHNI